MSARGSVKKDNAGRWYFVVDLPGGDKRRQVRRRGFRTQEDAQDALHELRGSVRAGTFVEPARTTLGQYLALWLDGLAVAGKRPTTIDSYRRTMNTYVIGADIGHVPLQALTGPELDRLYSDLATSGRRNGKGLSLRTVHHVHSIIGKALADAERKGLLSRNPARFTGSSGRRTSPASGCTTSGTATPRTSSQRA